MIKKIKLLGYTRLYRPLSVYALLITLGATLLVGVKYDRWNYDRVIIHDAISYYSYLPAALIFNDLHYNFGKELPEDIVLKKLWTKPSPIDKPVQKMTMGNAICWLPFFGVAHAWASISDKYENHGYSMPYYLMIFVAAMFYLALGLIYLRKFLLRYFSDIAVAVTLILTVLATNLLFYTTIEPGMSHVLSFTLITVFIYHSFNWLKKPKVSTSIYLGLILGLITLIRPSNGIVVLFTILIFLVEKGTFQEKLQWIGRNFLKIILIAVMAFVVLLPQLIYWKTFTGSWVYYSYGNEGFYFDNPHIVDGLLSYRKGWLVYTPLMVFAFLGLLVLPRYFKLVTWPMIIFSVVNIYIIFSWWTWWYGGSYGSRPMIDTYGMYAIPLAAFTHHIFKKKIWKRVLLGLVFMFFVYLNIFQIKQYVSSLLHYDSMTREAYWAIFMQEKFPKNYQQLIRTPDYEAASQGKEEYLDDENN